MLTSLLYIGPTEVQWHCKARIAAGATFYIVGRDPAGMPHPDTKENLYDASHGRRVSSLQLSIRMVYSSSTSHGRCCRWLLVSVKWRLCHSNWQPTTRSWDVWTSLIPRGRKISSSFLVSQNITTFHSQIIFLPLLGTKMRTLARNGETPPDGFMAPSAWKILCDFYQSLARQQSTV